MLYVNCPKCGEQHYPNDILVDDIEEDIQGFDIITYICPATGEEAKALVIRRA